MPYPNLTRRTELAQTGNIVGQFADANSKFLQRAHKPDGSLSDLVDFTSVPYTSALFFGNGAMTWGVDAADVIYLRWARIGTFLIYQGAIGNTDVGGAANTSLQVRTPIDPRTGSRFSFGPADTYGVFIYHDAGGARSLGVFAAIANETYISLQKTDGSAWTGTAGDNTNVYFNVQAQIR
jgi:hypothetical protein